VKPDDPSGPPIPRIGGPLDDVNDAFHGAYAAVQSDASKDAPVLVVLADALIGFRGSERTEVTFTPRSFHVLKSVSHGPVAVFMAVRGGERGALDAPTRAALAALRDRLVDARAALESEIDDMEARADSELVATETIDLVDRVLAADTTRREDLSAFTARMGPPLLRLLEHATRVQLVALHEHVEELLARMTADERRRLVVVVTGDHQARVRSFAMQYFRKRFGETGGEEHVLYGEGITSADEARALVGKNRADRDIAQAFFGDAKRLQRDLLGDAAAAFLATTRLPPIA